MSRQRDYGKADSGGKSHGAGGQTITRRDTVFAFTTAQRIAVRHLKEAMREEDLATKALAIAIMHQQMSAYRLRKTGLNVQQIADIMHISHAKTREVITHGQLLIEGEESDV